MEELEQLSSIFPERPTKELSKILFFHDNNVNEAVEAVLAGEMTPVPQLHVSPSFNDYAQEISRTWSTIGLPHPISPVQYNEEMHSEAAGTSHGVGTPDSAAAQTPMWWDSPTIVAPPQQHSRIYEASPIICTPPPRNEQQIMMEQHQDEAQLEAALKASMAPSDKGRLAGHGDLVAGQTITDEKLEQLMLNPAFLAQMDPDLRAAIQLQRQLDYEEQQKASLTVNNPGSMAPPIQQQHVPANLSVSVRSRLFSFGDCFLRRSSSEEKQLAEKLEAINKANEEHQKYLAELESVRKEAEAACMQTIVDHFESFVEANPFGTYEEWIAELHPENAHDGTLLEGLSKTIDHRFYVEDSDHRILWNDNLDCMRRYVPARHSTAKLTSDDATVDVLDLLGDHGSDSERNKRNNQFGHCSMDSPKDLIAFERKCGAVRPTMAAHDSDLIAFE